MTQFEQENDLGRGGGELDNETMEAAERTADERRSTANIASGDEERSESGGLLEGGDEPWAKFSSGRDAGDEDDDQGER